SAVLQRF
nr:Rep protein [Escherichia coli, plasmid ColE2, Peptide Plasmid Partial, 7 aa] [Escherichia coli]